MDEPRKIIEEMLTHEGMSVLEDVSIYVELEAKRDAEVHS